MIGTPLTACGPTRAPACTWAPASSPLGPQLALPAPHTSHSPTPSPDLPPAFCVPGYYSTRVPEGFWVSPRCRPAVPQPAGVGLEDSFGSQTPHPTSRLDPRRPQNYAEVWYLVSKAPRASSLWLLSTWPCPGQGPSPGPDPLSFLWSLHSLCLLPGTQFLPAQCFPQCSGTQRGFTPVSAPLTPAEPGVGPCGLVSTCAGLGPQRPDWE